MVDFPNDSDTGVPVNKPLVYTFDQPVEINTIITGGGLLYDVRDNAIVEGVWSISDDLLTVTFMPEVALVPNTTYTWNFAGADDDSTIPVKYTDDTSLVDSVFITFQTGSTQIVPSQSVISSGTDQVTIQDGQTLEERLVDEFRVVKTTPAHMLSFVDVTSTQIKIEFSKALAVQNYADYVTLRYSPLLRETYLFHTGHFNRYARRSAPGVPADVPAEYDKFLFPAGTFTLENSDKTLVWTKTDPDAYWNANAFVHIDISGDLTDEDDNKLNISRSESFYFLTDIYPLLSTVESTLLPLSALEGFVSEEIVIRLMLEKSLEAWNIACKKFSLLAPPRAAQQYVEVATAVSILDQKGIQKEWGAGKSIKLSELSVTYDYARTPEMARGVIRSELGKKLDELRSQLALMCGAQGVGIIMAHPVMPFDVYRNQMTVKSGVWNNPGQNFNY